MATKIIAWNSGGGYITLTYTGVGNALISVSSDANDLFEDRQQTVQITTTNGSPQKAVSLLVKQKGKTYPVGTVFNYDYTGSVQQVTLPKGKYKLQCWGAQGGNVSGSYTATGSKGGYSEGVLTITEPTTIYIFVGGQGTSSSTSSTSGTANGGWNGGGASTRYSSYDSSDTYGESYPRPGGGATDMCLVTSNMSYSSGRTVRSSESLLSRFIVAGGGAGASARYTKKTSINKEYVYVHSAVSNNTSISLPDSEGISWYYRYDDFYVHNYANKGAKIEIQSDPDTCKKVTYLIYDESDNTVIKSETYIGSNNTFYITLPSNAYRIRFQALNSGSVYPSYMYTYLYVEEEFENVVESNSISGSSQQGGGEYGKGQYPGAQNLAGSGGAFGIGANQTNTNYRYDAGAGGGGWYGGGTSHSDTDTEYVNYSGGGSGFVNTAANAGYRPSGYTGMQLESGSTKDGSTSFESPTGGTETGHSGNGYARITVLE